MEFTPSAIFKEYAASAAECPLGSYRDILPYRTDASMGAVYFQI